MEGVLKLPIQGADSAMIAIFVEVASFYGGPLNLLWAGGQRKGKQTMQLRKDCGTVYRASSAEANCSESDSLAKA